MDYFPIKERVLECLLGGRIVKYDACSIGTDIKDALEYYRRTPFKEYIGSSFTYFIDGYPNESEELIHFFRKI